MENGAFTHRTSQRPNAKCDDGINFRNNLIVWRSAVWCVCRVCAWLLLLLRLSTLSWYVLVHGHQMHQIRWAQSVYHSSSVVRVTIQSVHRWWGRRCFHLAIFIMMNLNTRAQRANGMCSHFLPPPRHSTVPKTSNKNIHIHEYVYISFQSVCDSTRSSVHHS